MKYRYRFGERPLDGYTIRRGVGLGAFGEVYYAVSDGGREVALKSILRNEEIELRGVRQCINLKSPQLVSIFDVRPGHDGTTFVIMEYVTGPSLRDIIREHPRGLGAPETTYLMREIGKGLTCLHDHGIVHRDLKPENIFYEEGRAKIGDYGLAKLLSASHQSGQTMSVGTVHYMAPEIGSGNYHRGIDIYSLGIILHELLTGRVPFEGDSFGEILMKHLTAAPDLCSLAEPFRSAVAGSLIKDPRERFQTVDDMLRPLLGEESFDVGLSTLHPRSLSTAAMNYRPETGPAGAAPLEAPAVLTVAESRSSRSAQPEEAVQSGTDAPWTPLIAGSEKSETPEERKPVQPEPTLSPARRRIVDPVERILAWLAAHAWSLVKKLGAGVWTVAAGTGRAVKFLVTRPFRRRSRTVRSHGRHDVQPARRGVVVRLFWASVGSAIFAGGVCCIVAPFLLVFRHPEEILICLGIGLALAVFGRRVLTIVSR